MVGQARACPAAVRFHGFAEFDHDHRRCIDNTNSIGQDFRRFLWDLIPGARMRQPKTIGVA
jgi:hypothetical protein